MCGIVGCAGSIYKQEIDTFENMLVFSQVRGPHSTGVASVARGKDQEFMLVKDIGRPDALIDWNKRYEKVVAYGKRFILGHNRWATSGKINKRAAHPYEFSNIIGCHNGTVSEHHLKDLPLGPADFNTDSETILANMNSHPMKEVFSKLDGAWAFVWYDNRNGTLNMLRNGQRDLYYTYSLDRQTIYWASEVGFIEAALQRNNVKWKEFHKLPENRHVRWVIPEVGKAFDSPVATEVKGKEYQAWAGRFRGQQGFDGDDIHGTGHDIGGSGDGSKDVAVSVGNGVKHPLAIHSATATNNNRNIISADTLNPRGHLRLVKTALGEVANFAKPDILKDFEGQGYMKGHKDKDYYRGYRGERLFKKEFEEATKSGCSWCDQTAIWGRPVRFIKRDEHICLECNSDPQIIEMYGTK